MGKKIYVRRILHEMNTTKKRERKYHSIEIKIFQK